MNKNYLYNLLLGTALIAFASTFPSKTDEYKVNISKSKITWLGEKLTGEHTGKIQIKHGKLLIDKNKLIGGEFTVDMSSITNMDISSKKMNQKLVNHLKSDDFFGVEKYPTSLLKIVNIRERKSNTYQVRADLTIKGKTNPIEFTTTVNVKNSSTIEADAKLVIDRTKYDVRYGSSSFFDNLGDKVIYDNFELDIKLVANK